MTDFTLHLGDCLETLKTLPDCSVDSVITDPPYGLSQHTPQQVADCLGAWLRGEEYKPKGKGFMGKSWDAWVPSPAVWRECLRVLKPGGHLLAFAGTRSMDLMSMAVRLAGFELRDSIGYAHDGGGAPLLAWAYGSGFPKSLDVSKAIDKAAGAEREVVGSRRTRDLGRNGKIKGDMLVGKYDGSADVSITAPATDAARQWQGWGTALKPAWEPIILARKPLEGTVAENVLKHGTGALNIDGCRVAAERATGWGGSASFKNTHSASASGGMSEGDARQTDAGRWPANLIHNGSPTVLRLFPTSNKEATGVVKISSGTKSGAGTWTGLGMQAAGKTNSGVRDFGDAGSTARFFYCAKASKADRNDGLCGFEEKAIRTTYDKSVRDTSGNDTGHARANHHPTVKPADLMRYLCRLVTPPNGTVLDPFTGSGSTGKAAILEGFNFIGCEMQPDYHAIAKARISSAVDKSAKQMALVE